VGADVWYSDAFLSLAVPLILVLVVSAKLREANGKGHN
jgi:hypothetical protein